MARRFSCRESHTSQSSSFLISKSIPKSRCSTRFKPEFHYLSLFMSMTYQTLVTTRLTDRNSNDAGQWAMSKSTDLAAKYLQKDLDKLATWCAKWRIKLNLEKNQSHNILQVHKCSQGRACFIFIPRPPFVLSSHKINRYCFRQRYDYSKTL